jgi:hypothetical protein
VSDAHLGVLAFVTFGWKPLGQGDGTEPHRVRHSALGITWIVTEVLGGWQHPGGAAGVYGQADAIEWWQLEVSGPLPARPPSAASS